MKKLIFLCVALLVAPAIAEVQFIFNDNGGGTMTISYTTSEGDLPRGIALHLLVTSGDGLITGYEMGSADDKMNCFIDYAYSTDPYNLGEGHPLADPAGPGALDASGGVTEVSICMGALDQTENQLPGDPEGVVATLTYTGSGLLTISADTLRGPDSGVVGSELASNLPLVDKEFGEEQPDPCLAALSALGYEKQLADYNLYKANGADPSCWCNPYQCVGDANNDTEGLLTKYRVYTNDLNRLLANWKKKIDTADPCADVAHDSEGLLTKYRVYTNDLNLILANWKAKDGDLGIPGPCPKTDADMGL